MSIDLIEYVVFEFDQLADIKNVDMIDSIEASDQWTTWRNEKASQMLDDWKRRRNDRGGGMENKDMNSEHAKAAGTRRKWTNFEEDALLSVLDDFVTCGLRCETRSFKSGTLLQMKKSLEHNKNAKGWRNKSFPIYDHLALIFGKDRVNGRGAETPADMVDEQSINDINPENVVNDVSLVSLNQESSQTEGNRKRKRVDETDKIVVALEKVFEESGKRMQMITDAILKSNEDRSDIVKELKNMGLSVDDQIAALRIILERPQNISIFKSLDDDVRRVYVQNLLMSNI
ncbi:hypothetical protein ACLB2K_019602 [Fragaria x ananassa]